MAETLTNSRRKKTMELSSGQDLFPLPTMSIQISNNYSDGNFYTIQHLAGHKYKHCTELNIRQPILIQEKINRVCA